MSLYLTGINSINNNNNNNNNNEIKQQSFNIKPIKIKKSNKILRKNKSNINKNLSNKENSRISNKKSKLKIEKKFSKSFDSKNKSNNLIEIKTKFINFLIDNELKYANLYNIEIYYEEQIKKKKYIHDNNLIIIQQKKQKYKNYLNEIQKEIINKFVLQQNQINDYYNIKINNLKKIIRYKQYEQEIFQNIFNRTYKTNFLMKNRINEELNFSNVFNEQYKQYLIIKNNSLGQINIHEEKLKYVKEFNKKILSEQKNKIKKKIEIGKNLEIKLSMLKENMKNYSLNLNKIKNQNKKLKIKLNFFIKIYNNINIEYQNLLKEYFINKLSLLKIFNLFELKNYKNNNIDTFILYVKDAKKNINLMRTQIINKNFEITKKNIIISQLNKELKEINDKIKIKNINEKKNFNKNDSKKIEQLNKNINQNKFEVSNIQKKNIKNILLIEKIINLLIDKNKILFFNFPSLKKSYIDFIIRNKSYFKLNYNNNFFDCNIYKDILNKFNKLINSIVYVYINIYNKNLYKFIINHQKYNNDNNFMIFNFTNINLLSKINNIKEIKEKIIIENKKNEKDDYKTNSKNNSNLNNSIYLSKYDLFNKFVNYIDNNNSKNNNFPYEKLNFSATMKNLNSNLYNKSFILFNQNKIINYFDKYENNLVKKNNFHSKNNNKNMSKTSNKFNEKNNLMKSKSFKESHLPSINKNKKIQEDFLSISTNNSHHNSVFLEENMEYDSEDNEKIEKNDTLKKKKQKLKKNQSFTYFFLKNPEKSQVLTRLNDLRKLNISFFNKVSKNEEKNIDNFKFKNELLNFIKLKKKEEKDKKQNDNKEIMSERPRAKTFNIFGNFKFKHNKNNSLNNSKNLSCKKLQQISQPNKNAYLLGKNKIKKIEKKRIDFKSHSLSFKNKPKNNYFLFKKNNLFNSKEDSLSQSKIKYYKPNHFN